MSYDDVFVVIVWPFYDCMNTWTRDLYLPQVVQQKIEDGEGLDGICSVEGEQYSFHCFTEREAKWD